MIFTKLYGKLTCKKISTSCRNQSMKIGISGINGRIGNVLTEILTRKEARYSDLELIVGLDREMGHSGDVPVTNDYDDFLVQADMVIDFSLPDNLVVLAEKARESKTSIVSGTTGLSSDQITAVRAAAQHVPILHAGNMSVGVNLLCKLVKQSAESLGLSYDIEILETHHNQKRDAPSGTALMLGHAAADGRKMAHDDIAQYTREGAEALREEGEIGYAVRRGGNIIGEHSVSFYGASETIELSHFAKNRSLFAEGALFAAQWLYKQKENGLYSMADALEI